MKQLLLLCLLPALAIAAGDNQANERKTKQEIQGDLWQASITAESSGDKAAALAKMQEYAKAGGDPYLTNLRCAWLNYSQNKYDEAERFYKAAATAQHTAVSPLLGLLNIAQAQNDTAAAAKAAEVVLRVEPTNYRALMALAWGAFQAKDYRKSGSAYQKVLVLYPEDQDALSGAAWCAFYTGQKREAANGFLRLQSLNPNAKYLSEGLKATR